MNSVVQLSASVSAGSGPAFCLLSLCVSLTRNLNQEGVGVVSRKFYGLSGSLFDLDDAFVDLIDSPKVLPVLKWVLTKGAGLPHLPGEPVLTAVQGQLPAPVTSPRMEDIAGARQLDFGAASYNDVSRFYCSSLKHGGCGVAGAREQAAFQGNCKNPQQCTSDPAAHKLLILFVSPCPLA